MREKTYCKECETELSEKAKFCSECGKPAPKQKLPETKLKEFPPIMTVNEAAAFLKISRWKLYDLLKKNQLPCFPVGCHKRFLTSKLIEWAEKQTNI